MDPEQTAPDLGSHCLPKRLLKHFSRREKQTTFVAIGALRVNPFNPSHILAGHIFAPVTNMKLGVEARIERTLA